MTVGSPPLGGVGQFVCITASGLWTANKDMGRAWYGPQGDVTSPSGLSAPADYPLPGGKYGCLVGRIGENGRPFYVGELCPLNLGQMQASGVLQFVINDDLLGHHGHGITDNAGHLDVHIEVWVPF